MEATKTQKPLIAKFTVDPIELSKVRDHQYVTKIMKTANGYKSWLLFGKRNGNLIFRKTRFDKHLEASSDGEIEMGFDEALAGGFAKQKDIEQALFLK